jgi:hypothetical protein
MERHRAGPYCRSPTAGDTLLRTEKLSFLTLPPDKLFLVHAAIDTALKIAD